MNKLIVGLAALITFTGTLVGGFVGTAEAHFVQGCPHWYIQDGEYTAGMAFLCDTSAAGTHNFLQIKCSNGQYLSTPWVKQGQGISYGKICPGTSVVDQHWIFYGTF